MNSDNASTLIEDLPLGGLSISDDDTMSVCSSTGATYGTSDTSDADDDDYDNDNLSLGGTPIFEDDVYENKSVTTSSSGSLDADNFSLPNSATSNTTFTSITASDAGSDFDMAVDAEHGSDSGFSSSNAEEEEFIEAPPSRIPTPLLPSRPVTPMPIEEVNNRIRAIEYKLETIEGTMYILIKNPGENATALAWGEKKWRELLGEYNLAIREKEGILGCGVSEWAVGEVGRVGVLGGGNSGGRDLQLV